MRILVHGASLERHPRMANAARALALRGHAVTWMARGPGARAAADVVIGGGERPARVALAGWLAGARVLVLAIDGETSRRWSPWQRWCWESLEAGGVTDAGALAALREAAHADAARLVAWPEDVAAPAGPEIAHPDVDRLERLCERSLARRRSASPRRAAFVDRDGTLVVERNYARGPDEMELLPGAAEGLRMLAAAGYALVVLSNQAGVGRGYFPLAAVYETMARLRHDLRRHGVELDAIYFCPHHPDDRCSCRKPGIALLKEAAANANLALRESAVIGDKLTDVATARNARALGVLVRTGYGAEEEGRAVAGAGPDVVAADLLEAARWIVSRPREGGE